MVAAEPDNFRLLCEDLLRSGRGVRFRATGTSMHPAIRDGELVTVEPVDASAVRRGDVVLFRSARGLTAHRVTRVVARPDASQYFVLRGDNTGESHEHVATTSVLGCVIGVERGGRVFNPGAAWVRATVAVRALLRRLKVCAVDLVARGTEGLLHEFRWRPDGG